MERQNPIIDDDIGNIMDTTLTIILAVISSGICTVIIQAILNHRKNKAETKKIENEASLFDAQATKIIQNIAIEQIAHNKKQMEEKELDCKQRIDKLEKDNETIKKSLVVIKRDLKDVFIHYVACVEGAHLLVSQIIRHKEEPCYVPPPLEIVKKRKLAFKDD